MKSILNMMEDIEDQARELVNDAQRVTRARSIAAVNRATRMVLDSVYARRPSALRDIAALQAPASIDLKAGVSRYLVPPGFLGADYAEVLQDGRYVRMAGYTVGRGDDNLPEPLSSDIGSSSAKFRLSGGSIEIEPTPTGDITAGMRVRMFRKPPKWIVGKATGGGAATITLPSAYDRLIGQTPRERRDEAYTGYEFEGITAAGVSRGVRTASGYVAATGVLTVSSNWSAAIVNGDTFTMYTPWGEDLETIDDLIELRAIITLLAWNSYEDVGPVATDYNEMEKGFLKRLAGRSRSHPRVIPYGTRS